MKAPLHKNRRRFFLVALILCSLLGSVPVSGELPTDEEFQKGLALYKEKKYPQAAAIFEKLEKDLPENLRAEALFMRGQGARALEKWSEAEVLFSRAAKAFPALAD
jgi:TolA-binding protein